MGLNLCVPNVWACLVRRGGSRDDMVDMGGALSVGCESLGKVVKGWYWCAVAS